MKKIKVGIIGMGRMGITHFSIINSHPQFENDKNISIHNEIKE
jgi:hypothetical protein